MSCSIFQNCKSTTFLNKSVPIITKIYNSRLIFIRNYPSLVGFSYFCRCKVEVRIMKEFFEMTRHERRGAVAILVIIALLIAVTCATRCYRPAVAPADIDSVLLFESEVDSSTVKVIKPAPKTRKDKRSKPAKKRSKPSRSPKPSPRRMDPVPQF